MKRRVATAPWPYLSREWQEKSRRSFHGLLGVKVSAHYTNGPIVPHSHSLFISAALYKFIIILSPIPPFLPSFFIHLAIFPLRRLACSFLPLFTYTFNSNNLSKRLLQYINQLLPSWLEGRYDRLNTINVCHLLIIAYNLSHSLESFARQVAQMPTLIVF